jgi:hypothetical protein
MQNATVTLALQDEVRLVSPATGRWKRVTSLSDNFVSLDAGKPASRRLLELMIADGRAERRSINALAAEQDAAVAAMREAEVAQDLTDHAPAPLAFGTKVHLAKQAPVGGPLVLELGVVLWARPSTMVEVAWEGGGTTFNYPHELEVIR